MKEIHTLNLRCHLHLIHKSRVRNSWATRMPINWERCHIPRASTQGEVVVGIDLGTTNSAIAYVANGKPTIVPSSEGHPFTPSVVSFREDGRLVIGLEAKKQATLFPKTTFYSVKRFIGRRYEDVKEEMKLVPFAIRSSDVGGVLLENPQSETGFSTPEEISSMILKKMIASVSETTNQKVGKAVISVPAYFDEAQRDATIAAGKLAGLEKVKLIKEPVASALGYGIDLEEDQTVLVFDLGGGTFDVSILEVGGGVIEVLATGGDSHLGGDDWDAEIINWLIRDKIGPAGIDWKDPAVMSNLRAIAEYAKINCSAKNKVVLKLPLGSGIKAVLTEQLLEKLSQGLFLRMRDAVDRCSLQAGVEPVAITKQTDEAVPVLHPKQRDPVSKVLLVGGSTRMPLVQRFVKNMTGIVPNSTEVDPDLAVAIGAAVQAGMLQGDVEDVMMMDVFQASLLRAFAKQHAESTQDNQK